MGNHWSVLNKTWAFSVRCARLKTSSPNANSLRALQAGCSGPKGSSRSSKIALSWGTLLMAQWLRCCPAKAWGCRFVPWSRGWGGSHMSCGTAKRLIVSVHAPLCASLVRPLSPGVGYIISAQMPSCIPLFETPWMVCNIAYKSPLSMGFSKPEYWSG